MNEAMAKLAAQWLADNVGLAPVPVNIERQKALVAFITDVALAAKRMQDEAWERTAIEVRGTFTSDVAGNVFRSEGGASACDEILRRMGRPGWARGTPA